MRWSWRRKPAPEAVPTARALRDAWLKSMHDSGFADRTISGYLRITDHFLARWPELRLDEFTSEQLEGFIEEAGPRSRQQRRAPFHNWFKWAKRLRHVETNPMDHVQTYKQPKQEPVECFTDAECQRLISLPHPDGLLMAILFGTGIRKSEARHLTPAHVDFLNRELHITEGVKGGSVGVIPISEHLTEWLLAYVMTERLGPHDYFWYCHPGGSYLRHHNRVLADGAMQNWWKRCIEDAEVKYRKLHATRHTFATVLRRQGMPIDDVSDMLRHADPRTTRKVYIHLKAIDQRRRMDELAVTGVV